MSDEHLLTAKDHEIDILIRARYPLIYIISPEEDRVEHGLRRIVNGRKLVQSWSATQPFGAVDPQGNLLSNQKEPTLNGDEAALDALNFIERRVREDVHAVYILRDFDPYLDNPVVVRRLRDLGYATTCLLGNHDLYLLVVSQGVRKLHKGDTVGPILEAPDRQAWLDWLRHRPLAVRAHGWLMVHAGVVPQWDADQTAALAGEVQAMLRGPDLAEFLPRMYGNEPAR